MPPPEPDLDYQRAYYADPDRSPRIAPARSRYVGRHLDRLLGALALPPPARLLEVGAGRGRFSRLLAERGYDVTAVDLSPELLAALSADDPAGTIRTVAGDAAAVHRLVPGPFDAAVGFFFLHHLDRLEPLFASLAQVVRPGGRVAFAEPNAWQPLFYAQILLSPTMTWRGDRGVARMRPGVFRRALDAAGFEAFALDRYGLLPPALSNRPVFARLEEAIEPALGPLAAFQVLSATRGGAS